MQGGSEAPRRRDGFGWRLAAIVLIALTIRCGYIAGAKRGPCAQRLGKFVAAEVHSQWLGGAHFVNDQYWYSRTPDEVSHRQFFRANPPAHAPVSDHPTIHNFVLYVTASA